MYNWQYNLNCTSVKCLHKWTQPTFHSFTSFVNTYGISYFILKSLTEVIRVTPTDA